jgi:hypothetical protein
MVFSFLVSTILQELKMKLSRRLVFMAVAACTLQVGMA